MCYFLGVLKLLFKNFRAANPFTRGIFISSAFSITTLFIFLKRLSEISRSRTPLLSSKLHNERRWGILTLSVTITTTFSVELVWSKCVPFVKLVQFMIAISFLICLKTKWNLSKYSRWGKILFCLFFWKTCIFYIKRFYPHFYGFEFLLFSKFGKGESN